MLAEAKAACSPFLWPEWGPAAFFPRESIAIEADVALAFLMNALHAYAEIFSGVVNPDLPRRPTTHEYTI